MSTVKANIINIRMINIIYIHNTYTVAHKEGSGKCNKNIRGDRIGRIRICIHISNLKIGSLIITSFLYTKIGLHHIEPFQNSINITLTTKKERFNKLLLKFSLSSDIFSFINWFKKKIKNIK